MPHSYCRHRFTTMKRWQSGDNWYVIQHCRWCDKWQRKTIEISAQAMQTEPKLVNEVYRVNDVGIKKVEDITDPDDRKMGENDSRQQNVGQPNSPPKGAVNE